MKLSINGINKKFLTRVGIWIGIMLAVVILSIILVIERGMNSMVETRDAYLASEEERLENQAASKNLALALGKSDELDSAIEAMNAGFVPAKNPLTAITPLENLISAYQLTGVIDVTSTEDPDTEVDDAFPVKATIDAEGSYVNVLEFIEVIQQQDTIIAIDNVLINRGDSTSDDVTLSMVIRTYWR